MPLNVSVELSAPVSVMLKEQDDPDWHRQGERKQGKGEHAKETDDNGFVVHGENQYPVLTDHPRPELRIRWFRSKAFLRLMVLRASTSFLFR